VTIEHTAGGASLVDVLDRVLDKGIVIDAWMQVSLGGINLMELEARVVVASINIYLTNARALAGLNIVSSPLLTEPARTIARRRRVRHAPNLYSRAV
jgi:gas vesicle structural protein